MTDSHDTVVLRPDPDRVQDLQRKIFEVTFGYDLQDKLEALVGMLTCHMATVCPQCRQGLARALKKRIPKMLADAHRLAALSPTAPEHYQH